MKITDLIKKEAIDLNVKASTKKEIIENINKCKRDLGGQDINSILMQFPIRKRIFVKCALAKLIFPLKLYVELQQKMIEK